MSDKNSLHNIFNNGARHSLGVIVLTEEEIISFALKFDPLPFHTSHEGAVQSPFKKIIASGPHIFTVIHRDRWIPLFGHTVIAGLEIIQWKFIQPVYPDQTIKSFVTILDVKENPVKRQAVVKWKYEFKNEKEEDVQTLEMVVLHKTP